MSRRTVLAFLVGVLSRVLPFRKERRWTGDRYRVSLAELQKREDLDQNVVCKLSERKP